MLKIVRLPATIHGVSSTFGKFLVVGVGGTIVNLVALWLLVSLGILHLIAVIAATEVSIINNFIWNDRWTFQKPVEPVKLRLTVRFLSFQFVASITGLFTIILATTLTNQFQLYYLLAQLFAIAIATALNFLINSWFTWRIFSPKRTSATTVATPLTRTVVSNNFRQVVEDVEI